MPQSTRQELELKQAIVFGKFTVHGLLSRDVPMSGPITVQLNGSC